MGRRFLRVDDRDRSYLFLFSVRHPHWRRRYVDQIVQVSPEVAIVDGWERTELDSQQRHASNQYRRMRADPDATARPSRVGETGGQAS